MSAQCRHGLIRHECWQCRDEASQATHVSQVFAGGLVTAVQQIEALEKECSALRQERDAVRAENERLRALLSPFAKATDKARHLCRLIHHDRIAFDALLENEELSVALTATQAAIRVSNEALDVFLSGKQK